MNYLQKNIQWLRCLLMGLSALLVSAACNEYDGPLAERDAAEVLKDFKFELLHDVTLDVDYGPMSSRALIEVFEENPLADATADDQSPKGQPLYTTFLDEDGSFHGTMNIPTCVEHVYVYSPSWGTPMLMDSKIKNNRAMVSNIPLSWPTTRAETGGGERYTIRALTDGEIDLNGGQNFYTINGGWNAYGRSNNENGLIDNEGTMTSQEIKAVQFKLWGNTEKVSGSFDNRKLRVANVNVKVLETFVDENGDTQDVQDATVYFTMISEAAWNENAFGYYFYPLNTEPDLATIKKYIILPNISIEKHAPFGTKNSNYIFPNDEAPAYQNMRCKLLYEDAEGNVCDRFPPNTEIGFFLMSNAFDDGSTVGAKTTIGDKQYNTRDTGKIKYTADRFYDSNPTQKDMSRYIALALPDNTIVYGVEDGANSRTGDYGDKSFEDMIFTLTANPNKAIKPHDELPDANKVDPDVVVYSTVTAYTRTYAFEDIWPEGGDYDLNDVVVEHRRTFTLNQYDYIKEVVDEFKVRSIATHCDGFAIQLKKDNHGTITLPQGAEWEEATGSIIITKNVQNGQTFTIKREFADKTMVKKTIQTEDLNPYIINYTLTTDPAQRIEVHLPTKAITSKGKKMGQGNSDYYVDETVKFPYAILIPVGGFKLSPEGVRIDKYYTKYTSWTDSKGGKDTDWYKYPDTSLDK